MGRRGQPQKPYLTSWGEHITGLYRGSDLRWRIVATGERFTEADERIAVKRFREWEAKHREHTAVQMTVPLDRSHPAAAIAAIVPTASINGKPVSVDFAQLWAMFDSPELLEWDQVGEDKPKGRLSDIQISYPLPGLPFWSWLGKLIVKHPKMVADNTGIPELAGLKHLALPGDALRLSDLIKAYMEKGSARLEQSKKVTVSNFTRLITHSGAVTLDDLTVEKLNAFRTFIESDPNLKAASSIKKIFNDAKTVVGFGLKVGLDAVQINAALDRMKVLWTSREENPADPHPISRENLHTLLASAKKINGKEHWTAWILLGLNCGLKMGDIVNLEWATLDLHGKTYCSIRSKTRTQRIPQAACLWEETIAALKALPRTESPYVFTSCHGTKFNRNGRGDAFADFRDEAGVKREDGSKVCFDDFRDGAYTESVRSGASFELCQILCGHKCGMSDKYVLRDPGMVKPASDAVYKAYFGKVKKDNKK